MTTRPLTDHQEDMRIARALDRHPHLTPQDRASIYAMYTAPFPALKEWLRAKRVVIIPNHPAGPVTLGQLIKREYQGIPSSEHVIRALGGTRR